MNKDLLRLYNELGAKSIDINFDDNNGMVELVIGLPHRVFRKKFAHNVGLEEVIEHFKKEIHGDSHA